jgi:hypothetical protein
LVHFFGLVIFTEKNLATLLLVAVVIIAYFCTFFAEKMAITLKRNVMIFGKQSAVFSH